jgi:hypothetical protein
MLPYGWSPVTGHQVPTVPGVGRRESATRLEPVASPCQGEG